MSDSQMAGGIQGTLSMAPPMGGAHTAAPREVSTQSLAPASLFERCFSFPAMLAAAIVAAVGVAARSFVLDPDVWWHIKQGGSILATHHVPRTDSYSLLLSGRPWTAYEWLGDVVLAITYRAGGLRGMELMLVLLGSAIMLALYALGTLHSKSSKAGFVAAAMLFVPASASFNLRPQMLGYLFLVLTLIILELFRQGHRTVIWLLPPLMLMWVNSHGSWVIGLGVIGVYLASGFVDFQVGGLEARRWSTSDRLRLGIAFVLSCCATLITPYGAGLAKYPFQVASSFPIGVANVIEWESMPFHETLGKVFLVMVLGFISLQVCFRFSWRLAEFFLLMLGIAMACIHVRFLLLFVPFFAPLLATMLARWVPPYERQKDHYLLNALLMATVLGVIVWFFPSQAKLERVVADKFPVGAVAYLDSHQVPGPMFNNYGFGGYLVFARGPESKVFMDGRSELYERGGVLADFVDVINLRSDTFAIFQKYNIQSCLLAHDEPLGTVLAALPDWEKVYEDHTSVLFVRRNNLPLSATDRPSASPIAESAPTIPSAKKEKL